MRVEEITVADAGAVARLVAALLSELSDGEVVNSAALEVTAVELLQQGAVTGFLARETAGDATRETEGAPLGVILLNSCAAIYAGGIFGEITELYVQPEYRSQGLAARLIEAAEALGRARGWTRLEVGAPSQPAWQRTLSFYQRSGFLETGPRLRKLL